MIKGSCLWIDEVDRDGSKRCYNDDRFHGPLRDLQLRLRPTKEEKAVVMIMLKAVNGFERDWHSGKRKIRGMMANIMERVSDSQEFVALEDDISRLAMIRMRLTY